MAQEADVVSQVIHHLANIRTGWNGVRAECLPPPPPGPRHCDACDASVGPIHQDVTLAVCKQK